MERFHVEAAGRPVLQLLTLPAGDRMASRTMVGTFSIVRPYPGQMGRTVEQFVDGLDLTPALGVAPSAGTSDEQAARWISRTVAQLLVVPFHFHRGADQSRLDGIGALLYLPANFDFASRVIFMPVRAFSWTTSFQPRFEILKRERPRLAEHLIVAHEGDFETPALQLRVKRALEALEERRSLPPASRRPPSMTPTSGDALHRLGERFSLPPRSMRRRTSGAWKFSLPEEATTEERYSTAPPPSAPLLRAEEPTGIRPIYEDFIEKKKNSG